MKNYLQSYYFKNNQKSQGLVPSIANDEMYLLEKRLEFFLPNIKNKFGYLQIMLYLMVWAVFVVVLQLQYVPNIDAKLFLTNFFMEVSFLLLTFFPGIVIYEMNRHSLMNLSIIRTCIQVWMIFVWCAVLATFLVRVGLCHLLAPDSLHGMASRHMILDVFAVGGFVVLFLIFHVQSYHRLIAVKESFELKIAVQNDVLKNRLSPHFFFNMMNGLTSLIESNPKKAVGMLSNISALFRASFSRSTEISFDEEIRLCQLFLDIDEMRFHGKLNITWDLPDEDVVYDMVITSMTLQSVLERLLNQAVEMTTEMVDVNIIGTWENHMVQILLTADMPMQTLMVHHDVRHNMNFKIQERRLQHHYGDAASINFTIENHKLAIKIKYPLYDAGANL